MGLEKLKSAFSNILLPKPTNEKQGVGVDMSKPSPVKSGTDINPVPTSMLVDMKSEFSIQSEPQEVDYMHNTQGVGFTAAWPDQMFESPNSSFVGIDGNNWNSTTGFYTGENINYPGPVDFIGGENSYYS